MIGVLFGSIFVILPFIIAGYFAFCCHQYFRKNEVAYKTRSLVIAIWLGPYVLISFAAGLGSLIDALGGCAPESPAGMGCIFLGIEFGIFFLLLVIFVPMYTLVATIGVVVIGGVNYLTKDK